ncbi:MAG: hypothetical protein HRT37_26420 [Alteromonadaceae bacterium]|nr:hypothetical protein [Alteromonadaceae bacterium]
MNTKFNNGAENQSGNIDEHEEGSSNMEKVEETARRDKIIAHYTVVTNQISQICRIIAFGIITAVYAIFNGSGDFAKSLTQNHPVLVGTVGFFAVLTVIVDYLQYLLSHASVTKAIESDDNKFEEGSFSYKGSKFLFKFKQLLVGFCSLLFLFIVSLQVLCD